MKPSQNYDAFINEVAEMETSAYTLQQLANQIRADADEKAEDAEWEHEKVGHSIDEMERKCESIQKKLQNRPLTSQDLPVQEKTNWGGGLLLGGVVGSIVMAIAIVACHLLGMDEELMAIIAIAILIGSIIVCLMCYKRFQDSAYEQKYQEALDANAEAERKAIEDLEKELKIVRQKLDSARQQQNQSLARFEQSKRKKQAADQVAQECQQASRKIKHQIMNLHKSTNIVPPDYRSMDCILAFQQIFRNDLADTMREAVKIYDERVFRGEVIRGIEKISAQLGQLNSSMEYMQRTLTTINNNVSMMSQDVFRVSQTMDTMSGTQDQIFEQAKATRYAAESLKKSQKFCEEYIKKYSE